METYGEFHEEMFRRDGRAFSDGGISGRQAGTGTGGMHMKRRRWIVWLGIGASVAAVNAVAWESSKFCDWYVRCIYPLWVSTYGRFTGMFSFSVGEWMLVAGVVLTVLFLLAGAAMAVLRAGFRRRKIYGRAAGICKRYMAAYAWIFAGVAVVMTLNCFIPYHCSSLEEKYGLIHRMTAQDPMLQELMEKEYTIEELGQLRDYVVLKCNELAKQVERDEDGNIIYPENMEELAAEAMRNLSLDCSQLGGYYPQPKQFAFSEFFSQQMMKGYFFPFSMEVNYNSLMHEINRPATVCHEYAHLKGFMYEEEANMIGFLACIHSSEATFQYSGYLSVLNYINNEFYEAIGRNAAVYASHVKISAQVRRENVFLEEKAWEQVEQKAVISTEVVDKVSDKLSETSMVLNGVEDGILSYTRVVGLLLHYYDGSAEVQETLASLGGEQEFFVQSE